MNTNELVAGGGDVKVRLLLVDEEGVGHPDVLDELRADAQRLDARPRLEREPRVRPELPEVEIQREVLTRDTRDFIRDGHRLNKFFKLRSPAGATWKNVKSASTSRGILVPFHARADDPPATTVPRDNETRASAVT